MKRQMRRMSTNAELPEPTYPALAKVSPASAF